MRFGERLVEQSNGGGRANGRADKRPGGRRLDARTDALVTRTRLSTEARERARADECEKLTARKTDKMYIHTSSPQLRNRINHSAVKPNI